MPKIFFIDESLEFGGSIVSLSILLNNLDREKYKILLTSEISNDLLNHYFGEHVVKYRNPKIINYKSWASLCGFFEKKIGIRNKTFYRVFSVFSSILNIMHNLRLFMYLWKEKPEIVHFNNGMNQISSRFIVSLFSLSSLVHQRAVSSVSRYENYLGKKTNYFISISNYISGHLHQCGVPLEKIQLFHDPVPKCCDGVSRIDRGSLGISEHGKCFGIFGRIIAWKGQIVFVKAAIEVILRMPNVYAIVVGDGSDSDSSYFEEIKKIVNNSGVSERIIFTGYTKATCDYYNIMNVVVHASIVPEPFGMVVSEAMAHGIPVIASNEGGPLDMIENGVDGFLIEPNNVEALRDKIIEVLSDDKLQKYVGERAKNKASRMFDARSYAAKFEALYDQLGQGRD